MRSPLARTAAAVAAAVLLLPATAVAGERHGPDRDHHARDHHRSERSDGRQATYLEPALVGRATLSADYLAEGPASGAAMTPANGRQGPFDGQVVPGFSAILENRDGTFWAQPDNGFGAQANSADFLLRLYHVRADWSTGTQRSGSGDLQVLDFVQYNDRNHVLDFPIVNEGTAERNLTGADFDIESAVKADDGTLWVGDEFGPFVLHFAADGTLLSKPIPMPGGLKSPQNPYLAAGETPQVGASRGYEAMAASSDGRYLYPISEGVLASESDKRKHVIFELDTRTGRYTDRTWSYQADMEGNLVADAFTVGKGKLWVVERDDFQGAASVTKRIYEVNLRDVDAEGFVTKSLVVDALDIANPRGIDADQGLVGITEDSYSLPVQSFETVVRLRDGRILIANDNNFPGNSVRVAGQPDDTELAILELRKQRVPRADDVTVIGHRGASGYRPEHTLASYETAILQGADVIEPDVVPTKDGVLVARHENEIGGTTDVADHPEFADRRTTKVVDGVSLTGWFTEDFTLAELRTLRAKERIPAVRPQNTTFDGLYQIPTLDEVFDLARHSRTADGRPVAVAPETKHPTYFDGLGLSLEEPLVAALAANGLNRKDSPVMIQSFEVGNLVELDRRTPVDLVQLVSNSGQPWDLTVSGDPRTYADLVTPEGIDEIADYADYLSVEKTVLIPREADGTLGEPSDIFENAHDAGLDVVAWTFRRENQFLPAEFRSSTDPNAVGDLVGEIRAYVDAGLDAFFTDNPDLGVAAVS